MKKLIITLFTALHTFLLTYSQNTPLPVTSQIKEITVFASGAQVTRNGSVSLKSGNQQLVFENLPQSINAQSIQVSGKGNFTILSVNNQINYLKPQQKSKEILTLEDSLETLQNKLNANSASLEILKDEESLLKANQSLGGSQTGVKVDELKAAVDLFRTYLNDIKTKSLKLLANNKRLNYLINNVNNQLTQLRNKTNTPTSEVVVTVLAPMPVKAQLTLSYLVSEASWIAAYDVRATDVDKPVELTYKAKVSQSSGESWDNVKLTLSTGNPAVSGSSPELYPWYLTIIEPQPISRLKSKRAEVSSASPMAVDKVMEEDMYELNEVATTSQLYTEIKMNQTSTEFAIDLPYNILTDGKQYTVEVKSFTLSATYQYYCVPKIDTDVFLLAKITGWEDLNLVSGETSLFFEGTYVGAAYIDTQNTKDTMNVSLGRDKSIVVTRTRQNDFTSKKLIGSTRKDTRSFEITARNTKKKPINIIIDDQIPISTTKEIEVESTNIVGGTLDKATGKISYRIQLQPAESKSFINSYTISYPKGKTVVLE